MNASTTTNGSMECSVTNTIHRNRDKYDQAWDDLSRVSKATRNNVTFLTPKLECNPKLPVHRNYFRILFSLLIRAGMRELGQKNESFVDVIHADFSEALQALSRDSVPLVEYSVETLAGYLFAKVYPGAQAQALRSVGIDPDAVRQADWAEQRFQCERAAAKALENFDTDTYRRIQERAVKGGSVCKTTFSDFLEIAGMTVTQAAKHLGVSRGAIYRLRDRYKNIDSETGEIDD
jgi:hypothetical protein